MKIIIAFLCSFVFLASSHAATVELRPAGPTAGSYRWQCAATGFTDAQIVGACQEKYYSAGRFPKTTLVGTWSVSWDLSGNPTLDMQMPAVWPGCNGTNSVVEVDGTPYYFIGADSLGDELVENYCVSYFVTP